jgi:hypothetical protein
MIGSAMEKGIAAIVSGRCGRAVEVRSLDAFGAHLMGPREWTMIKGQRWIRVSVDLEVKLIFKKKKDRGRIESERCAISVIYSAIVRSHPRRVAAIDGRVGDKKKDAKR